MKQSTDQQCARYEDTAIDGHLNPILVNPFFQKLCHFAVFIFVGFTSSRKLKDITDFPINGKDLFPWEVFLSIYATTHITKFKSVKCTTLKACSP